MGTGHQADMRDFPVLHLGSELLNSIFPPPLIKGGEESIYL